MKTFIKHNFEKLNRVTIDGTRFYEVEDKKYPSVTSVTGLLSKKSIDAWRKSVGEAEANKISTRASNRGTRIHSLCEDYVLNGNAKPDMFDADMFNSLLPHLDKIDTIHAFENSLYSHELEVAGTVDCIAEYDGKLCIIDFKTSSKVKNKEYICGYFMQTAAYAVAFEELTKIKVEDIVIIIGTDNEKPSIFKEKVNYWVPGFKDLREEYRRKYCR